MKLNCRYKGTRGAADKCRYLAFSTRTDEEAPPDCRQD